MTPSLLDNFSSFADAKNWVLEYYGFDVELFEKLLQTKPATFWYTLGQQRALNIFHHAARRVPAYQDFLKGHGVDSKKIKTIEDFTTVPATDKHNYIQAYPLAARSWDGKLDRQSLVAISSGTSGEPTFWPRGGYQEFEQAIIHEVLYRAHFQIHKRRTLMLICFPMGVYVSGIATLIPSWLVAQKYPNLSLVSVGNKQTDILKALANLKDGYEQIALVGHPFIIKDVLETAKREKISLKNHRVGVMCCSESFNEDWRTYVEKLANAKIFNTYGSSELLLIGYEMPSKKGYWYNPLLRYAEMQNNELLFTAASGVPLIRFNLHDTGSVKNNIITLQGRSDHTVIFYAANIYPEHIRAALNRKTWYGKLTGKFTMEKTSLRNRDEALTIHIELRSGIKPNKVLTDAIGREVVATLKRINLEYVDITARFGSRVIPRIVLHPYQEPKYFPLGLKPRYII